MGIDELFATRDFIEIDCGLRDRIETANMGDHSLWAQESFGHEFERFAYILGVAARCPNKVM